jgi:hypothetical protein
MIRRLHLTGHGDSQLAKPGSSHCVFSLPDFLPIHRNVRRRFNSQENPVSLRANDRDDDAIADADLLADATRQHKHLNSSMHENKGRRPDEFVRRGIGKIDKLRFLDLHAVFDGVEVAKTQNRLLSDLLQIERRNFAGQDRHLVDDVALQQLNMSIAALLKRPFGYLLKVRLPGGHHDFDG